MLFNPEINSIEEDILYHETQIKEAQERLDQVKLSQAYSDTVISSLEDFFENTDPFLYEVLKGHVAQMFEQNKVVLNNDLNKIEDEEDDIEYKQSWTDDDYKSIEQLQSKEPDTVVAVFHSEEYLKEQEEGLLEIIEEEEPQEVQTPNIEKIDGEITYNHVDSIAYLAFRAKGRADSYGSYLTRILDIAEKYTVSNKPSFFDSKYELRLENISLEDTLHLQSFNLSKEYDHSVNKEARELWRETRLRKYETSKPRPKAITIEDVKFGAIVSTSADAIDKKQYKVLSHKELNGEQHLEVICIYHEFKSLVNQYSYLKEVYPVELGDIKVDPQFNPSNFQEEEEVLTEDVNIYIPKETVKKSEGLSDKDFPSAPYKPISLDEVEVCDVISTGEHITTFYEVTQNLGNCIEARCLYSRAFPNRVGEEYTLSTVYLVEKAFDMAAPTSKKVAVAV